MGKDSDVGRINRTVFKSVPLNLSNLELITKILFAAFLFFILYYFYFAITTTPEQINESDSLAYHIPIAESLAKGKFLDPPKLGQGLGFYPAVGEAILALIILLHIPLNLYNVVGLVVLFIAAKKVGESFGLNKNLAIIFAVSASLTHSLVRLALNQTVDVWLTSFFLLSLYFVNEVKHNDKSYFKLGVFLGLLIGIKYSGILFALAILIVFYRKILINLNVKRLMYFLVPFTLLGLFWYLRNFALTGNPLYPSTFLIWKGDPTFPIYDFTQWSPLGNFLKNPRFAVDFLSALNSEFLLWPLVIILVLLKERFKISKTLVLLGILNFVFFLFFLPYWPGITITNLRLAVSAFIPLILALFLWAQKNNRAEIITSVTFLNVIFLATQLDFHPKLFTILTVIIFFLVFYNNKIFVKIFN